MSQQTDFERTLADHIASEGVSPPSDAFYDELISRAGRSGQRPEWLALLKEPPMRHESTLAVGSPTVRIAAILAATVLLLAVLAGAGIAGSRLLAADGTIVVDPSGNGTTTTIQGALDLADDGDEIIVRPGTYAGPIEISDDIVLRGEDRDTVILQVPTDSATREDFWYGPSHYGILLDGTAADVSGLTIQGFQGVDAEVAWTAISVIGGSPLIHDVTTDDGNGAAVYYQGAASGELRDSSLQGLVAVQDASTPRITNNDILWHIIVGNPVGTDPVVINGNRLSGIAVAPDNEAWSGDSAPALIEDNVLRMPAIDAADANQDFLGIDIVGNLGTIVRGNHITGFQEGINLRGGSSSVLEGNTLTDNRTAIQAFSGDPRIADNTITGGTVGISVVGAPELVDNDVSGVSGRGLVLSGSATLRGNTSCDNGEDLFIVGNATPDIDDSNEICVQPADT
jgi:parallel beta-helix repeat protein